MRILKPLLYPCDMATCTLASRDLNPRLSRYIPEKRAYIVFGKQIYLILKLVKQIVFR